MPGRQCGESNDGSEQSAIRRRCDASMHSPNLPAKCRSCRGPLRKTRRFRSYRSSCSRRHSQIIRCDRMKPDRPRMLLHVLPRLPSRTSSLRCHRSRRRHSGKTCRTTGSRTEGHPTGCPPRMPAQHRSADRVCCAARGGIPGRGSTQPDTERSMPPSVPGANRIPDRGNQEDEGSSAGACDAASGSRSFRRSSLPRKLRGRPSGQCSITRGRL